ncbi:esterase family protein [Dyadobacter sp. 3J3]|uniref:alpha/beta hydrolase n=1 Tax=Dyadobacter sp. 3J3 TaxID=2606600 RepID=UPI00135B891E|nr:alpha/beta hydrolase-fold protein [Dyadobacter sp. 3J3]
MEQSIFSLFLHREVLISVILPVHYNEAERYPLLLINDGQDFDALRMNPILTDLQINGLIESIIVVGIHAGTDRLHEYGTVCMPDYAHRGSKAGATTNFVLKELLPFLNKYYQIEGENICYAGFSLGGLMALDMVLNHPDIFSKTGVFSGALWWRQKALGAGYRDSDRIMHQQIRNSTTKSDLKFWFQTGTNDETDDRDDDGIIDSIQDTLECIAELERKGFVWGKDIAYCETLGGEHNPETWAHAMPDFLIWAFGKNIHEKQD